MSRVAILGRAWRYCARAWYAVISSTKRLFWLATQVHRLRFRIEMGADAADISKTNQTHRAPCLGIEFATAARPNHLSDRRVENFCNAPFSRIASPGPVGAVGAEAAATPCEAPRGDIMPGR